MGVCVCFWEWGSGTKGWWLEENMLCAHKISWFKLWSDLFKEIKKTSASPVTLTER